MLSLLTAQPSWKKHNHHQSCNNKEMQLQVLLMSEEETKSDILQCKALFKRAKQLRHYS